MPTVFVSGATGYIAQHVTHQFLDAGYSVIGTVRSAAKGDKLASAFHNPRFSYVVVPDIQVDGAFDQALKDHPEAVGFIHTASPFHYNTDKPEQDLMIPAVRGTTNVLTAITKYGTNIVRVVVTSSYATMFTAQDEMNPAYVRDESSWNNITWDDAKQVPAVAYVGSKVFAEKAAWEFYHMEKPAFTMATVNPAFVFGPQLFDHDVRGTLNTSAEIVNEILKQKPTEKVAKQSGAYIDVRDVARAHLVAFEKDEAHGQRLLMSNGRFTSHLIRDIIAHRFPRLQSRLPQGVPESSAKLLKRFCSIDNSKTRRLLGFELTSLEQSTHDTVKQIADANNW